MDECLPILYQWLTETRPEWYYRMFSADKNSHRIQDIRDVWIYAPEERHRLVADIRLSTQHTVAMLNNCITGKCMLLDIADPHFFERVGKWVDGILNMKGLMSDHWWCRQCTRNSA